MSFDQSCESNWDKVYGLVSIRLIQVTNQDFVTGTDTPGAEVLFDCCAKVFMFMKRRLLA